MDNFVLKIQCKIYLCTYLIITKTWLSKHVPQHVWSLKLMDAMLLLLHLAKGNWSFCLSVICHQTSKPLMDQIFTWTALLLWKHYFVTLSSLQLNLHPIKTCPLIHTRLNFHFIRNFMFSTITYTLLVLQNTVLFSVAVHVKIWSIKGLDVWWHMTDKQKLQLHV
jgi:hypothetical protein